MKPDLYEASVKNMRDTAKWFMGSLGAIFVVLLAGVQFSDVPFLTDRTAAFAGVAAVAGVMLAFHLTIGVLTGGAMSYHELKQAWRFGAERDFIDSIHEKGWFKTFCAEFDALHEKVEGKTLPNSDTGYRQKIATRHLMLCAAKWHVIKRRFDRLVIVMLLLIPVELGAAAFIFALPEPPAAPVLKLEYRPGR